MSRSKPDREPRSDRLERFQKKIRGRLKSWKEDEHRADKLLQELASNQM